jgi:2-dehydropantoate 2-reductase
LTNTNEEKIVWYETYKKIKTPADKGAIMKIVIIGAGAIGRLFGVYLSRSGHEIIFVDPVSEVVEAINRQGIGFMAADSTDPDAISFVPARAVKDGREIKNCDLLLLAVKSFATLAAVQAVSHLINKDTPLVTLQTGLGNIEKLQQLIAPEHIIGGFTFMAAAALAPGIVRQGGIGKTYLGELDGRMTDRLTKISTMLAEANLPCTPVRRFIGRLWCKIIVYSAINSLSAILKVKNGQLLESMEAITLMKRLIDEGRQVAEAQAIDLVFPDLYQILFDACHRTENNLSSMLQDVLNGNRTEIEAQCEALAAFGRKKGVAAPTQQTMAELVKLLAEKNNE